jgi:phosphatidylglycerophosphate synthase
VRSVQTGPATGLAAQLVLLGVLAAGIGLSGLAWAAGLACAVATTVLVSRSLTAHGLDRLGPADRVTLARASLVVGVTALTAESFVRPVPATLYVGLTAVALALDAVDGATARRTGTASAFGARFDMEVDAFLILVLSVYVAPSAGAWVLAIGLMRYAYVAVGWSQPWLRGTVPPRYWRKVVAAVQGVTLAVAAAGVLPYAVTQTALVVALLLLLESFGRDVVWLWRRRASVPRIDADAPAEAAAPRSPVRRVTVAVLTVASVVLVWFALVAPNELTEVTPGAFVRIPLEGLVLVGAVLVLPRRVRSGAAVVVGVALGLLAIVKLLDMGFFVALGRPSNPVVDWRYTGAAVGLLTDSVGGVRAAFSLVLVVLLGVALLVLLPLAVLRFTRAVAAHRTASLRTVGALGAVWVVCALLGVQLVPGAPVASTSAASLTYEHVSAGAARLQDQQAFAASVAADRFRDAPVDGLLSGLRGKDVIVAFVESYSRGAVEGTAYSAGVDSVLADGTARLDTAGFGSRSGWLTSPTFGGLSWLAHGTLQSGVWTDDQRRYDALVASDRATLSSSFARAGWRTVADVPSNERPWPEGASFYRYAQVYDEHNVGYAGPKFSYAAMPDQYVLSAFHRLELARPDRAPVMAEIDLVSSHTPWTPLPRMVPWSAVGDGSVFGPMAAEGPTPEVLWRDRAAVQASYGRSVEYSLTALVSYVETYGDPDLVLVVVGDHAPSTIVSDPGASHDVPISVVAHDPAVLARIGSWGWTSGLRPAHDAPLWAMSDVRDRFLTAFSTP